MQRSPEARQSSADQHHHHDKPRLMKAHHVRVRGLLREREQRAGESRDRGGHDEHDPFAEPHAVAEEPRAHLVLPDAGERATERRMDEAPAKPDDEHQRDDAKAEKRIVRLQRDSRESEIRDGTLEVEQAVLAAGHRMPLDRDEPEHLAERDRQQRVVDAAPVRNERAHDRAGERRRQDRPGEIEPEIAGDALLQETECVGADAEECAMAERRKAGMPEQQVVALRIDHPDRDLEREVRIEADAGNPPRRSAEQQRERNERQRHAGGGGRAVSRELHRELERAGNPCSNCGCGRINVTSPQVPRAMRRTAKD